MCNSSVSNDISIISPGTNCQKKELFVMTVQAANRYTLPGNLTIIPSAPKWVFHAIYKLAYPFLCSSTVCARNQVILKDEDDEEYKSFETVMETMDEFKDSKVMLCTFCVIWMAFKKDLITLLDKYSSWKAHR